MAKPDTLQGSLDLLILKILSRRAPLHGYALLTSIIEISGHDAASASRPGITKLLANPASSGCAMLALMSSDAHEPVADEAQRHRRCGKRDENEPRHKRVTSHVEHRREERAARATNDRSRTSIVTEP